MDVSLYYITIGIWTLSPGHDVGRDSSKSHVRNLILQIDDR